MEPARFPEDFSLQQTSLGLSKVYLFASPYRSQ